MFKKNLNEHGRFPLGLRPCLLEHHDTRSARAMKEIVHFIVHRRSPVEDSTFRFKSLGPLGGSINMLSISLYFTLRTRVHGVHFFLSDNFTVDLIYLVCAFFSL